MSFYKLLKELPFLRKDTIFAFEFETACIYLVSDGLIAEHSLRSGLSGYLWMLFTERETYFEQIFEIEPAKSTVRKG